jgi:FMN phosphatase YigB (HAD superfamily)
MSDIRVDYRVTEAYIASSMKNDFPNLIVLDLGNVLLDYNPERFAARLAQIAKGRTADEILERYARGEVKAAFERGQTAEADFFSEMVEWLGLRVDATPFVMDVWNDVFTPTPGAERAVQLLGEKATLWMLSDTNITHLQFALRRFPFLSQIERIFASFQCGYMKSEPQAFEQIIAATRRDPQEIIFYDDLEPNVATAHSLGIDARLFMGWKGMIEKLKTEI